jgi:hypothetical protein
LKTRMIKDKTCIELINRLISQQEFSKAEIILSRIQGENERLKSIGWILEELIKKLHYDEAFTLVNKYLEGNELIFHRLLVLKHQQEHNSPINVHYLNLAMNALSEFENNKGSVKTNALLAEILFRNNDIELANRYNELAFTIWENGSMEFSDLSYIVLSLKAQHQSNNANEILNNLLEEVNCGDDYIAEANCRFEINQLKSLLTDETDVYDEDEDGWFQTEESNESSINLDAVKTAALQFLSKPRFKRTTNEIGYNGSNHPYILFDRLDNYRTHDTAGLKNELNSLRSQFKSVGSSLHTFNESSNQNIIELLADYCALSQVFFMEQEVKISDSILNHALSIALNQDDSHHPSTLNFSAGPKYECLYLVCYHHLIQGKFDLANRILEEMDNTYQSLGNQFNLFSLCDDSLTWISNHDMYKSEILEFLYEKLSESLNSTVKIISVHYAVRILAANASDEKKNYVLDKLNELLLTLKSKTMRREEKEACIIEVCKGLLKFDGLESVTDTIHSMEFTEKNLEEIHERIANFYLRKEPDLIKLFSKMKVHERWLLDMNMKNILDEQTIKELTADAVTPVIFLFSERPENLEVILKNFSVN